MKNTAEHFGFKFSKPAIKPQKDGMLRVLLDRNGTITTEYKDLKPPVTTKISISPVIVNSSNEFLYYKTTYRPYYFDSYKKISKGEIFDEIFFNENKELTEGSRSSIILQINGKLYTPPVKCGLLNGILRQSMKNVSEKILYKSDLEKAEKIFCINSVRGIVEVQL